MEHFKLYLPYFLFRTGCLNMFEDLHRHKVPLLIFSAGLGDIIVETITQRGKMFDNMKVVSNFMDFNGQVIKRP